MHAIVFWEGVFWEIVCQRIRKKLAIFFVFVKLCAQWRKGSSYYQRYVAGLTDRGKGLSENRVYPGRDAMTAKSGEPVDLNALENKFRQWKAQHKTPGTVVDAHREVILDRVAQSMTFEGEPITVSRLKTLLERLGQ